MILFSLERIISIIVDVVGNPILVSYVINNEYKNLIYFKFLYSLLITYENFFVLLYFIKQFYKWHPTISIL